VKKIGSIPDIDLQTQQERRQDTTVERAATRPAKLSHLVGSKLREEHATKKKEQKTNER
jgi:hypothetical protein